MKSKFTGHFLNCFLILIVLFTGSACKKSQPFAISDEEKYWAFDMVFDEKFMEVGRLVFPEDTVSARQREPLESVPYTGKAYLTQNGPDVQGFVDIGGDTLTLAGTVTEDNDGKRWMGLDFEGHRQQEATHGIITVALDKKNATGDFIKVGTASGKIIYGGMRFDGIMRQDGGRRQRPRLEDCGAKLTERIDSFRSSTGAKIRVKMEKFERCMKATFLDSARRPLDKREIVVSRDLVVPGPTDTVKVYDGILEKRIIGKKPDGTGHIVLGEIKYIAVSGKCSDLKYYQYVQEIKSINGGDKIKTPWSQDGPHPYRGVPPMPDTTEVGPVLFDIPSYPETELPYNENVLKPPATVDYTHAYVTYVCCDKQLMGAVVWGYTVTYTLLSGKTYKTVAKIPPEWKPLNQINDLPAKDIVPNSCAGN